jgi:hypothetical protein
MGIGGIAVAVGLGASVAGASGCFELPPGSGDMTEDSGFVTAADYGIAVLPDAGPRDAGEEDAGMAPLADYGIVLLPDGGTP